jgi:membrane-associated phospholipid phosphatase
MKSKKITLLRLGFILGILLITGMVFTSLAEDVVNREAFSLFDPLFGNWLLTQTNPGGDRIFSTITYFGNALVISAGTIWLGFWLAKKKRWNQLIFLFLAVGGAALLNLILKNIFLRPRPNFPLAYLVEKGFSFPSGHAMVSTAFYGAAAYLAFFVLKRWQNKLLVAFGCLAAALLIGFSRLYLGVHYLTDVIAGWSAGGLWLAVCILGDQFNFFQKHGK